VEVNHTGQCRYAVDIYSLLTRQDDIRRKSIHVDRYVRCRLSVVQVIVEYRANEDGIAICKRPVIPVCLVNGTRIRRCLNTKHAER